jgi:hypothetical protein
MLRNTAVQAGHLRTPGIVAQLALGFQTFLAYASDIGAISETEHSPLWQQGWTALNEAAVHQQEYLESEDEVARFLTALAGALTASRMRMWPTPNILASLATGPRGAGIRTSATA